MNLFLQVNKLLIKQNAFTQVLRLSHSNQTAKPLYPLKSRKILKIKGAEAPVFLQGLITNDMQHFEEGAKSMYAMFLNNKGKVLYDTLIHKWEGDDCFLLECDIGIINALEKHLKMYKLKRKVNIEDISEKYKIWALTSSAEDVADSEVNPNSDINIFKDPRLADLGFRVLTKINVEDSQIANKVSKNVNLENDDEGYRYLRYQLGVSEGAEDLPPGTSFPLEMNCDYLHGVSFHKGCYIGQELTARIHHTGVIRKRLMPLKFIQNVDENLEKDCVISVSNKPKSNLGKLKGFVKDYGIGLIRIKEALDAKILKVGNNDVEVVKPSWWPIEAPKEKVITKN